MNHNKNGTVQTMLIILFVIGILLSTLVLLFVSCNSAQKPLSTQLNNSTITVYPGIVRTQDGITYDVGTAQAVQNKLQTLSNANVTLSSAEVDMEGTASGNTYQYGIFQASLKRFGEFVQEQSIATDYAVLTDFLITKTPNGGYAAGGIHCYLVNQNGEKKYALLLNSHHDIFNQGDLKANGQTPEDLQHVIEGCRNVLLNAVELDA